MYNQVLAKVNHSLSGCTLHVRPYFPSHEGSTQMQTSRSRLMDEDDEADLLSLSSSYSQHHHFDQDSTVDGLAFTPVYRSFDHKLGQLHSSGKKARKMKINIIGKLTDIFSTVSLQVMFF